MDFISARIRWAYYLLAIAAAQPAMSAAPPAAEASTKADNHRSHAVDFDAASLREGKFTYRLSIKDEVLGLAIIEVRHAGKDLYKVTFDSKDVGQRWTSSFGSRLEPIAATLDIADEQSPYSMSLRYSGTGVSGTQSAKGAAKPIAAVFDRQVIDQRVDWAAMMAARIPHAKNVEFAVYEPNTGLSRLVGSSTESQPIGGVLGNVPTIKLDYTIHKDHGAESYSVYATKAEPRIMLREDMPGELVSVLVAVED